MKTFNDLTEDEVQAFSKYQDEVIKNYKEQNRINNILLFGIGYLGNKVISRMKNIPNVSKLCSDINKKWLDDVSSENDSLLFLENYSFADGIWDTNDYADIYKQMIQNENAIIDKIMGFDYMIICTNSDDKMNSCLSEAVADTCKKLNKRFMICHSRDNSFHAVVNVEDLSKQRSKEFVDKMQKKKYILNEIPLINTNFAYDRAHINYLGFSSDLVINTNVNSKEDSAINTNTFAYVLEMNIMKLLEV